ncbi:MAG: alpha/beta hydrolase [Phycisphaerales bacterium]|nr:alpha/beta hydrolase [Phycisphaerales bacterium]
MNRRELISMMKPATRSVFLCAFMVLVAGCRAVHAPAMGAQSYAGDTSIAPRHQVKNSSASIWPSRWGDNPEVRGIIIEMDPAKRLRAVHYGRHHQGRTAPNDYEDVAKLAAAVGIESAFNFKVEGPGSFIFSENTLSDQPVSDPPDLAFRYVSAQQAQPESASIDADKDHIEIERTWFTYRDPRPDREVRGTLVLLPGMFGTPEPIVDATERYFTSKGYAVLRMLSHPSRYTQHLMLQYLDGKGDDVASQAAEVADQRVAECAYATDAALKHVMSKREDMRDKPIVLLGMSGGAMALPSVYAYAPEHYDAAVLIAGGANFLKIMIESNYKSWIDAILVDFDPSSDQLGKPEPGVVDTLTSLYLEHAKLDAYHSAPGMRDFPVLVLHATSDKAVPASTGDLLYERLGKPERWTYPFGHEIIFASLPTQIPKIEAWVHEQIGSKDEGGSMNSGG